ncbi:MAG: TetR/AcrR family transcriptional regulator [Actinomycetota bacterium]|nr:TetR/AcrR family transcriptional regulator [Actinomycetota bacterium]
MPKLVDPVVRRLDVVEALFRVVVRSGLQQASLRAVADEAKLNIGSVRHYFDDQQELMRFAMQSMLDRVAARLYRRVEELPAMGALSRPRRRQWVVDLLSELLPLDDARRGEVIVWMEFTTAARINPVLDDLAQKSAAGTRSLVRQVLAGILRAGLDLNVETERLVALLDGLSINAVLRPDLLSAADCVAALHTHLAELESGSAMK